MGFWEKFKEEIKEAFAPGPSREELLIEEQRKMLEEENKRKEMEKEAKNRNRLLQLGLSEEEIDAYDAQAASVIPASGRLKVMIVSDTHGHLENLKKALDTEKPIDMLLHCGDMEGDELLIRKMANCHCRFVAGNMDFYCGAPQKDVFSIGKHRFYLCHGHLEKVSTDTMVLGYIAKAEGAEAAFYGHTHVPDISEFGGVKLVNPGSIAKPRQSGRKFTYIIMELDADSDEAPVFTLKDVPDGVEARMLW